MISDEERAELLKAAELQARAYAEAYVGAALDVVRLVLEQLQDNRAMTREQVLVLAEIIERFLKTLPAEDDLGRQAYLFAAKALLRED